jgi:hypothetical protein
MAIRSELSSIMGGELYTWANTCTTEIYHFYCGSRDGKAQPNAAPEWQAKSIWCQK